MAGGAGNIDDLIAGGHKVFARPGGLATGVLNLHGAFGAVSMHGFGETCQTGNEGSFVGCQTGDGRSSGGFIRGGGADDDETAPPLGNLLDDVILPYNCTI